MELTILHQEVNPLLKRTTISANVKFETTTPSNLEVLQQISKKLGTKEELLVVKKIQTNFGQKQAKVTAVSYDSLKTKIESLTKHQKQKLEEAKTENRQKQEPASKEA